MDVIERGNRSSYLHSLRSRPRSEEHTSELQSQSNLVCRLLLEKKKKYNNNKKHYYLRSPTEAATTNNSDLFTPAGSRQHHIALPEYMPGEPLKKTTSLNPNSAA